MHIVCKRSGVSSVFGLIVGLSNMVPEDFLLRKRSGAKDLCRSLGHFLFEADHCSRFNRYLPWRYALGALILVSVAAGLSGWLMHGNAYVLLAGLSGVILMGLVWPRVAMWGLRGELRFLDSRVTEGETAIVEFEFANRLPIGMWGIRIRGEMGHQRTGSSGESVVRTDSFVHSIAYIPGWCRSRFRWEFLADQRGGYPAGELRMSTAFPFGLWEVSRPLSVTGELLVRPRTFAVYEIPEAAANDRSVDGTTMKNRVGHSGDLLALRSYRAGDPLKRIHWIQSARQERLIVCELQATAAPRVQVVLDLDSTVHGGSGETNTREWGIRTAASICLGMLRSGAAIGLVMSDREAQLVEIRSEAELLDRLARVRLTDGEPLEQVLNRGESLDFSDGLQIVITTTAGIRRIDSRWGRRRATHFLVIRPAESPLESEPSGESGYRTVDPWIELDVSGFLPENFRILWQSALCSN